ncbi:MAG TPA: hypothetical protein VFF79_12600 [Conexibacter sp.]|jgi:hypothetical protein|nr:hypothetical protein [Conexibacter sp.]
MTNAQRLERELLRAGNRGCTSQELGAAGVTHVEIEIDRMRRRGAVIDEIMLPLSKRIRYVLRRPAAQAQPQVEAEPEPEPLFDPRTAPAKPLSPYDVEAA